MTCITFEIGALCTWRDAHGERFDGVGDTDTSTTADGFVFEGAYRVAGPDFRPDGIWYHGVRHREESNRGLNAVEDLFHAGRFTASLAAGESIDVSAWALDLDMPLLPAADVIESRRARARAVATAAGATSGADALLACAADPVRGDRSARPDRCRRISVVR